VPVTADGRANDGAPGEGDNADVEAVAGVSTTPATLQPAPASVAPAAGLGAPSPAPLPAPRSTVAGTARGLRVPARITAATLRRRGVRVRVTCRPRCRVTLRLTRAGASRPVLARRTASAGPGTTPIVLRPARRTRLARSRALVVRATFRAGGAIARRIAVR
jgi:hypothetical protein